MCLCCVFCTIIWHESTPSNGVLYVVLYTPSSRTVVSIMEERAQKKNSHLLRLMICPLFTLLLIHLVLPRCDCIHLTKFCRSNSIACDFFSIVLYLSQCLFSSSHYLMYNNFKTIFFSPNVSLSPSALSFADLQQPPRFDVSTLLASVHRSNKIIFDSMHRKITKHTHTL